ncbi:hypothetical protein ACJ5ZS_09010 [Aeromonas salmonicida]|uniref:hypothetical protein n=1 Tax=Aeromonas salmonicida TaxID=645 RepID=UPI0038B83780
MSISPRCNEYASNLMGDHEAALDSISVGNYDVIAFMLAGSICYAEKLIERECPDDLQADLLDLTVKILCEHSSNQSAVIYNQPQTLTYMLATIAILRYRECVDEQLGGNQTPCTVSAIKTSTNISVSPDLCGIPRISKMISKIRKIPKIMMSLLRISTISKD